MSLEAKLDELIVALGKNTEALLASGGGKPATGRAAKPKEDASKFTAADVEKKFNGIKAADSTKVPQLKSIIADLGFAGLKELVKDPSKFDEAMAKLDELEKAPAAAAEDDDL